MALQPMFALAIFSTASRCATTARGLTRYAQIWQSPESDILYEPHDRLDGAYV